MRKNYDYCQGFQSKIERCLKCPYPDCVLDARKNQLAMHPELRPSKNKFYIIKRTIEHITTGEIVSGYYRTYNSTRKCIHCSSDIKRAKKFTLEDAVSMVESLPRKFNHKYEIVKRSDEIERIDKNK